MSIAYHQSYQGTDIFVTVTKFMIERGNGTFTESSGWAAAFKFGSAPLILDGEFLRLDSGDLLYYETADEAAQSAFAEARKLIELRRVP